VQFPRISCAEDLAHFAKMNKKLEFDKVDEAEQVNEAEHTQETEAEIPLSQRLKSKIIGHKTFTRKKQKISEESSSEMDKAEEVETEQETTLAVIKE
jgi:hypothetical protein